MKRNLFNPALYLDALRRTSLLGGLFTVLLCVQSALVFFGNIIGSQIVNNVAYIGVSVSTVSLIEINPCILFIPAALIPMLMLTLFSFLNSRPNSDFWHSTPFKRECVFITFVLAALTWAIAAALLSTTVSVVLFSTAHKFFAINYASVFGLLTSTISMSLLVAGIFSVAASLSGTMLNTLVVAAILAFLPRTIMVYFHTLTQNGMLFYGIATEGFGSVSLNLIFGIIFAFFFGEISVFELFTNYTSIAYTAGLGVAYIIIGLFLFKHRKSETASHSSVSKYLQAALRIIVSFVVCLIPIYVITERSKNDRYAMDSEQYFLCFVFYVIAVVVYFVYELITTKKAKNMLKAIPTLAILAVLNLAVIIAINQSYKAEYNYTPTPQNVSCIRISGEGNNHNKNYFDKIMSVTDIYDHSLETLLCDLYADSRKAYEEDTIYKDYYTSISVGFKGSRHYKYRRIYMSEEDYAKFNELLDKNQQIKNIYNVESIIENAVHNQVIIHSALQELTADEQEVIIDTYIEDIKTFSLSEVYNIAENPHDNYTVLENGEENYYFSLGEIYTTTNIKGENYRTYFPIDNRMPKTYKLIMSLIFEKQKANDTQKTILDGIINDKHIDKETYVYLYNGITHSSPEGYSLNDVASKQAFVAALTPALEQIPDASSRIASVEYYTLKDGDYVNMYGVFKVPNDADLSFLLNQ